MKKSKCIFYYSSTGKVEKLSRKVAKKFNIQQLEKITPTTDFHLSHEKNDPKSGGLLSLKSAFKQFTGWWMTLKTPSLKISDYDVIFVGTPVYVWKMAAPVVKFLNDNKNELKDKEVVLFKVSGVTSIEKMVDVYEKIVGNKPSKYFGCLDKEIDDENVFEVMMQNLDYKNGDF